MQGKSLPAGYVLALLVIIATAHFSRNELPTDWREYVGFAVAGLLLWWCFRPLRSDSLVDADAHEQTRKGFAFRLGQLFKRSRRDRPRIR